MAGPLRGIRVLEPCRFISGPLAGMLLGDLGADVVKIEHPEGGDPFRGRPTERRPFAPIFGAYNRNKQSVTLDLGTPQGREVYLALAERADVVLENFRPGVADRMGIGWEQLRERNPRLVYCTITGFGPTGPYAKRPSYDTIASGLSGLLSQLFDPAEPIPIGPAFSDSITGLYAVQGVLAALVGRSIDGRGQRVDTTMLGSMIAFQNDSATRFLDEGHVSGPMSRAHGAQVYGFLAQDGLPFAVHLSSPPKFFQGLMTAIGRPELIDDPRFRTKDLRIEHYSELDAILREAMRQRPRAEWFRILTELDVPVTPIYTTAEVFDDPQVAHMGMVEEIPLEGYTPLRTGGYALRLSETPCETTLPPPKLGEHTDAVLRSLGYEDAEIARLREARTI
jgi:formyl-CoA transferase